MGVDCITVITYTIFILSMKMRTLIRELDFGFDLSHPNRPTYFISYISVVESP